VVSRSALPEMPIWDIIVRTIGAHQGNVGGKGIYTMFVALTRRGSGCASSRAIYWTNNFTGTIGRPNRKGTGINQNFITGAQNLIAVTLHGDYIYWTNVGAGGLGNAPIGRARLDGRDVDQNFITAGGPARVAVEGKHIYWTNDGESGALGGGQSIGRANLDGTDVDQSFITGASGPVGVAVEGS
jgi:virginiamycin B lyase